MCVNACVCACTFHVYTSGGLGSALHVLFAHRVSSVYLQLSTDRQVDQQFPIPSSEVTDVIISNFEMFYSDMCIFFLDASVLSLLFSTGGINRAGKIPCRLTMLRVWGEFITALPLQRRLPITGLSLPQKAPSKLFITCSSNFATNNYHQRGDFIISCLSQIPQTSVSLKFPVENDICHQV